MNHVMMTREGMNRRAILGTPLLAAGAVPAFAAPDRAEAIQTLYGRFLAAQNARDLAGVRATLIEGPRFLWISDGKPFWGADALVKRMSAFQAAEVWRVTPDLARSLVVDVSPAASFLYQPLSLTLGPAKSPNTIAFLVNVLCTETPAGWRIAALFTTEENPQ